MESPPEEAEALDFHAIPVTQVTTVPKFGLIGLFRSCAASIRSCGAPVFRIQPSQIRPVPCVAPKGKGGLRHRVRVQTFPQYPTIVSDAFRGSPAADAGVTRDELRAQLPPERETWLLTTDLKKKIRESKAALRAQYQDFGVSRFLKSVNDPNVTWVRGVTPRGHETRLMGPGKLKAVDVYYVSDLTPANEDGCGRSLSDPACTAVARHSQPTERFESPRTLNHRTMLASASTYEGINTNLLYMGTTGSHFSWHVEDHLLQSVSYLQSGSSKTWFFIPKSDVPQMVRVLQTHMDPVVLAAAGGDVWKVLALKASLWPASFFLAHGIRVGLHKMDVGDFVVTGYGVPHSGFNAGVNVASAVNLACTGWFAHAIEHAEHWSGKLGMLIPFEKLLVLSALKLADGKWWCGDAYTYGASEPAELQRDVGVIVSYLNEYVDSVLAFMKTESHPDWKGMKPTVVDLERAPEAVQRFIVDNAIKPSGPPLTLPDEEDGTITDYSVDGAACPHCGIVIWLSVVVCPACIEQLGDEAGPSAPICCWRCAPSKYDENHYRPGSVDDDGSRLNGCHAPLVVQRLSIGRTNILIDELKRMNVSGGGERSA